MNKLIALGAVAMLAVAAGCNNKKKADAGSSLMPPPPPAHNSPTPMTPVTSGIPGGGADIITPVSQDPAPLPTADAGANPAPGKTYVVRKGDTLWSIATRAYGNGKQYTRIVAANQTIRNDQVNVGQKLLIP